MPQRVRTGKGDGRSHSEQSFPLGQRSEHVRLHVPSCRRGGGARGGDGGGRGGVTAVPNTRVLLPLATPHGSEAGAEDKEGVSVPGCQQS